VDLEYENSDLSMLVLLPDRKDGLRELERTLSVQVMADCVSQMAQCEVKLFLPRFKMTWGTVDLTKALQAIGMELPFTEQADFSGINGHSPPDSEALFISQVLHKAFVEVNEEGTEAAAASGVGISLGCALRPPPVPVFRADHPFLFAIRHRVTSEILFLGRVGDPTVDRCG
jgi:serpin B